MTYSSGNCLGFTPSSLFIPCGNQNLQQRYKIIFQGIAFRKKINTFATKYFRNVAQPG